MDVGGMGQMLPAVPGGPPAGASAFALCRDIPPIAQKQSLYGPVGNQLLHRAFAVWLALCLVGALPALLSWLGMVKASPALLALGWGLWLPGAGFLSVGGWAMLGFPLTMLIFVGAFWGWVLLGMLALPIAVWLGAAAAAYVAAGGTAFASTWAIVLPLAAGLLGLRTFMVQRNQRASIELGKKRAAELPAALAELDAAAVAAPDASERELTPDEIAAARYLLDRALQPIGRFDGFTRIDNFQLAALRYQLNYISYGLALLQCKYAPNFHGYLNAAQRYAIESLATPAVCSYWKLENLWGNFTWNPDPIGTRDNIMLTGFSLSPLTTYAANTGDLRYQQGKTLRFAPFRRRDTVYLHDAGTFLDAILWNWRAARYFFYACEPFWVFPICNAYALCGIIPYDRINGTTVAASVYEPFRQALEDEFITPDGGMHPELSALIGISPFLYAPQMQFDNLVSMCQVFNAIHPGYAKRWYALIRKETFQLGPDGLSLRERAWTECIDFGNYRNNPGMALGTAALAAREHGDDAVAVAALRKADELLQRTDTPGVLAYEGISNSANINLAVARWARRDDWSDLINVGPSKAALAGPVLTDCAYPDVLVARAMSDGDDLHLVVYHGVRPGPQTIRIERLQPGRSYAVQGAKPASFVASADATMSLEVDLNGRTEVRIRPELHATR